MSQDAPRADADTLPAEERGTAASGSEELRPGDAAGEYRVVRFLGNGAFGNVYEAAHPVIGKHVAIKVLRRRFSDDPDVADRFVAEARAVNTIRHPGIVDIFGFGELGDGRRYFVMEYLEGETLRDRLRRDGHLAPAAALPILREIGAAVDAAHAAEIIHRDLKPDNVFLCEDGAVKLLDFGVAKLLGEAGTNTATGVPIGTPAYMAPEQVRGQPVDARSDVYALGAMTYELVTGRLPLGGKDFMELAFQLATVMPPAPSRVRRELPRALDAPVLAMLSKDPSRRPGSASSAIDAFAAALEAGAPARRPRWIAIAVAGAAVAAGATVVAVTRLDRSESRVAATSLDAGPQALEPRRWVGTEEEAQAHHDRGKVMFDEQDYAAAAAEFEVAYQMFAAIEGPTARTGARMALSNSATSLSQAKDPVRAVAAFDRVLAEFEDELSQEERREIADAARKLRLRVGTLAVRGIPDGVVVRVDGLRRGPEPFALPVGPHVVTVSGDGFEPWETSVNVLAMSEASVEIPPVLR